MLLAGSTLPRCKVDLAWAGTRCKVNLGIRWVRAREAGEANEFVNTLLRSVQQLELRTVCADHLLEGGHALLKIPIPEVSRGDPLDDPMKQDCAHQVCTFSRTDAYLQHTITHKRKTTVTYRVRTGHMTSDA